MNIFREVKKRIMPYMKEKGFRLSGTTYLFTNNDIAYCIGFDTPGGLLYATQYVMPLYIPSGNRYYTYGNRLNPSKRLPILSKDADDKYIDHWCDMFCKCMEFEVLPFFRKITTPEKLVNYVTDANSPNFFCPPVFIERLKVFTYLYLQKTEDLIQSVQEYRRLLDEGSFLTNSSMQTYLEEVNMIERLLTDNDVDITAYCLGIIHNTKQIL